MTSVLLLPLGDDLYAVELSRVREVVPSPAITPLPGAPEAVLGVFSLRGDVVPALDTGVLLGRAPIGESPFCAVVDAEAGMAGLACEGRPLLADLGEGAGPAQTAGARGRFRIEGGAVTTLLVLEELLPGRLPG